MKKSFKILSIIMAAVFIFTMATPVYAATSKTDSFKVSTSDMRRPRMLKKGQDYKLSGKITANHKISKIEISVSDKDSFKTEIKFSKSVNKKKLWLSDYSGKINFSKLPSGVKELKISLTDSNKKSVNLTREFTVLGKAREPVHITNACKITSTSGSVANLTDSSDETYWSSGKLTIELPKNKKPDGILLKWEKGAGNKYSINSFDKNGKKLDTYTNACYGMVHKYYSINENAVKIILDVKKVDSKGICCLRVYEKGRVGVSVERWQAPQDSACDLMVFSAHRDDELLFFGGTIPYYNGVKGKNVYTVYMSGRDLLRKREALAGQWSMGVKTYPIFMNFPGGYHDGISGTLRDWGGEDYVLECLVEKIRHYKPKVVVTHDENGEYGHPTHKTTSYIIQKAVKLAKDKSKYPDSYKKYGAWSVKKVYIHMYGKNKIKMNWDKSYSCLQGKTPYQLACIAYDKHVSQHGSWSMSSSTVKQYPSTNYGLAYTTVGYDKAKNDFFENVK